MSTYFREHGYLLRPLFSRAELSHGNWLDAWTHRRRHAGNPPCEFALPLLRRGMPLVKVELMRDNPYRARLGPIRAEIARSGYDLRLLEFDRPRKRRRRLFD
jgi:hypothetical protein